MTLNAENETTRRVLVDLSSVCIRHLREFLDTHPNAEGGMVRICYENLLRTHNKLKDCDSQIVMNSTMDGMRHRLRYLRAVVENHEFKRAVDDLTIYFDAIDVHKTIRR